MSAPKALREALVAAYLDGDLERAGEITAKLRVWLKVSKPQTLEKEYEDYSTRHR